MDNSLLAAGRNERDIIREVDVGDIFMAKGGKR